MFKNDGTNNAYVPSKSIAIKPDVVSDVIPDEISRALLPSYLGFIDPRETYIKFDLRMGGAAGSAPSVGMIRPQKEAGAHALFRNVLLRDGTNSTTLESLEDYNCRVAMKNPFTAQDSIQHKRGLFDGVMEDANLGGSSGNLYYAKSASLVDADFATQGARAGEMTLGGRNATGQVLTPQLQFRLDTGLMKGSQVIPVAALQGLRVQLDMENAARACEFAAGTAGQLKADGTVDNTGLGGGSCALNATTEKQATGVGANAVRNDARNAGTGYGQAVFSVQLKLDATADNLNNPFDVGDKLFIRAAIGRTINGTIVESDNQGDSEFELGTICGFYNSTDEAGKLGIYYVPQRAAGVSFGVFGAAFGGVDRTYGENDIVFYKPENRALAQSGVLVPADGGVAAVGAGSGSFSAPTYTVSDLEYLCLSVQPPEQYVQGLMSASTSERGVSMDIITTATQRFNQSTAAGLTSNHIPCSQRRVKSVFVQPLVIGDFRDFNKRSLSGVPDNARNYQFVYGTELIPVKTVPLGRYSQAVDAFGGTTANQVVAEQSKTEAIHLSQLEGALVNAGNMPRSLHKVAKNFAIGRAFSKYNQIADLSEQSLSCRIDYENTATELKIFNNYIDHLRRISITSSGVVASDL